MKLNKIIETGETLASMTAGAMLSRLAVEQLTFIKNTKFKRGALIAAGILGAAALDRKTTGRKIGQEIAIATAVTQTGHLLKELLDERLKDSKMHAALGSPMYNYDTELLDSSSFLSSYTPNYDFISEDIPHESVAEFAA
ncbi:hypothetical protein [Tenacibaculum amylolyticum]|uniref:hypothetical protein n=1 Tax=Tenacibaculum amylolyticum TaxID=104269 RepID=UPI003895A228